MQGNILERGYKMMLVDTSEIIVPRENYQREHNTSKTQKIVQNFDERIANEPKVSFRDGRYFVFDGQHTLAARKHMNGDQDLPVLCKVYFGLSPQDEAALFATQTGESSPVTAGARLRAEIYANEPAAIAFLNTNNDLGIKLDYDHERGHMRIGCIKTARDAYMRIGEERYKEAMSIIVEAWGGDPDSFRAENIIAVTYFVDLYHDLYDRDRLVTRLRNIDPLTILREGRAMGVNMAGYKKYLYQVVTTYNGCMKKAALPIKF